MTGTERSVVNEQYREEESCQKERKNIELVEISLLSSWTRRRISMRIVYYTKNVFGNNDAKFLFKNSDMDIMQTLF